MSQLWNLVPTILVLVGLWIAVWWLRRGLEAEDPQRSIRLLLGPLGIHSVVAGVLLLWLIPWGILLVLPVLLLLSVLSPAGREDWREHKKNQVGSLHIPCAHGVPRWVCTGPTAGCTRVLGGAALEGKPKRPIVPCKRAIHLAYASG